MDMTTHLTFFASLTCIYVLWLYCLLKTWKISASSHAGAEQLFFFWLPHTCYIYNNLLYFSNIVTCHTIQISVLCDHTYKCKDLLQVLVPTPCSAKSGLFTWEVQATHWKTWVSFSVHVFTCISCNKQGLCACTHEKYLRKHYSTMYV